MNLKKQYPIINFGRNYLGKTHFPAGVIHDMEVVSPHGFKQIVLDYVRQNRLTNRQVIVTLDHSLYFDKKFNTPPTTPEVNQFTSLLPFSTLSIKRVVNHDQTFILAVNKSLLTELVLALKEAKVTLKYIIPEFALKESSRSPYVFDDLSISHRYHLPAILNHQNSRLVIFALILIIICGSWLWSQQQPSHPIVTSTPSPTPTAPTSPTPTIGIPTTRISITYPTARTLRYSDQLKKLLTTAGYQKITSQQVATPTNTTKTYLNFNPTYPTNLRDSVVKETRKLFRNLSIQDVKDLTVDVQIVIGRL